MQFQRSSALPLFRRVALPSMFLLLTLTTAGQLSAQSEQPPATATPTGQEAPQAQAPAAQTAPGAVDNQSSSSADVQTARVVQPSKETYKRDVAVSLFVQESQYRNGNSIRTDTTNSGGGMASFRQSLRWWFGYEANYGYTKYSDVYFFGLYRIAHRTNEFSLAYLVDRNVYRGLHAFGSLGVGGIIFTPTANSGSINVITSAPPSQSLPTFVYSLGVEKMVTSRIGVCAQFRSDTYKDPDFKFEALNTHTLRHSLEPAVGVYYRF